MAEYVLFEKTGFLNGETLLRSHHGARKPESGHIVKLRRANRTSRRRTERFALKRDVALTPRVRGQVKLTPVCSMRALKVRSRGRVDRKPLPQRERHRRRATAQRGPTRVDRGLCQCAGRGRPEESCGGQATGRSVCLKILNLGCNIATRASAFQLA